MKKTRILMLLIITAIIFIFAAYYYNKNLGEAEKKISETEKNDELISKSDGGSDGNFSDESDEKTEAYNFTLNDLEGNEIKLSDYKGKIVILNFWATWCGPCQREMPDFNDMYENDIKASEDTVLFAINETDGQKETEKDVREFINENGYTFPVLLDNNVEVSYFYNIYNIPTTIIIDKEGYIYKTIIGVTDKSTVLKYVDEVRK